MNKHQSSGFDSMLKSIDTLVRRGLTFVTGEEAHPFKVENRQWGYIPVMAHGDNADTPPYRPAFRRHSQN
jgi:hypothetical protein